MKNLFKKNDAPAEPMELPLREARKLMPASAKSPDQQRLMLFNPDEEIDENTDEDLAFLNALVKGEPAVAPPAQRKPEPVPAEPIEQRNTDDMDVFREVAAQRQRVEVTRHLQVGDVDMGELLEELQTTRAAFRRRKAA